jgi:bifunctional non-homologous end joining protein LigD
LNHRGANVASTKKRLRETAKRTEAERFLTGARPGSLPPVPHAQLATLVSRPPAGDDWLHELKLDGYRVLARLENGRAQLWTRNGNDWTDRFRGVAGAVERLAARSALLDGEVVVQLPDGRTSFQALQNAGASSNLRYFVFDLLHLDGLDLSAVELDTRKEALLALVSPELGAASPLQYCDHVVGQGAAFFAQVCQARLEGIVSKRRQSSYQSGRSSEWQKVKCLRAQEFVIVGFTEPAGSRQALGALLVATHEGQELVYRGKVGTGFTEEALKSLFRRLQPIERPTSPL